MENSINYGAGFSGYNPSVKESADRFIKQIDKNHADDIEVQYGKHAKPVEATTTALRRPIPNYEEKMEQAEALEQFDMRYNACLRLQARLENNDFLRKETRKMTIKKAVGKIIAAGLLVITAGTCAGYVAAYGNPELGMTHEQTEEDLEARQAQALRMAYSEAGITPTEAELEAGLTPEQLQEKQALDAQLAEESVNSIGRSR